MLIAFASWLSKTPLTAFLENAAWAVPAIQTLHILCIAITFGGAVFIDLRLLGLLDRKESVDAVLARFLPPLAAAIGVLALTGALLIASEPNRAIFRTVFWAKMALIVLAIAVTWAQKRVVQRSAGRKGGAAAASVSSERALAVLSLALWVAVVFAGRWIGYVSGWPGSPP